jgi:hypothetical protein
LIALDPPGQFIVLCRDHQEFGAADFGKRFCGLPQLGGFLFKGGGFFTLLNAVYIPQPREPHLRHKTLPRPFFPSKL